MLHFLFEFIIVQHVPRVGDVEYKTLGFGHFFLLGYRVVVISPDGDADAIFPLPAVR